MNVPISVVVAVAVLAVVHCADEASTLANVTSVESVTTESFATTVNKGTSGVSVAPAVTSNKSSESSTPISTSYDSHSSKDNASTLANVTNVESVTATSVESVTTESFATTLNKGTSGVSVAPVVTSDKSSERSTPISTSYDSATTAVPDHHPIERNGKCWIDDHTFRPAKSKTKEESVHYCVYAVGVCGGEFTALMYNDAKYNLHEKRNRKCNIEVDDLRSSSMMTCKDLKETETKYGEGAVRVNSCSVCNSTERLPIFFACILATEKNVPTQLNVTNYEQLMVIITHMFVSQAPYSTTVLVNRVFSNETSLRQFRVVKTMSEEITAALGSSQERHLCAWGNATYVGLTQCGLNKRACASVIELKLPLVKYPNASSLFDMRTPDDLRMLFGVKVKGIMDRAEDIDGYLFGNACSQDYRDVGNYEDSCKAFSMNDTVGIVCCCYGKAKRTCQLRLQRGVVPSFSVDGKMRCSEHSFGLSHRSNYSDSLYGHTISSVLGKKATYSFHFDKTVANNGMRSALHDVCESMIVWGPKGPRHFFNNRTGLIADKYSTCEALYQGDSQLDQFQKMACFPMNEIRNASIRCITPMKEAPPPTSIMCCCKYNSFCNQDPDWHLLRTDRTGLCKYDTELQQVSNPWLMPDSVFNHSCLVHYVPPKLKAAMGSNGLIGFAPGYGFIPIDFSYWQLGIDECEYIDFKVNPKHLNISQCHPEMVEPLFGYLYVTAKLFVCRCSSIRNGIEVGHITQCDEMLANNIARFESEASSKFKKDIAHITMCTVYNDDSLNRFIQTINEGKHVKVNKETSLCYTLVSFDNTTRMPKSFSAGMVTKEMAIERGLKTDHLDYLMRLHESGREDRCVIDDERSENFCFCKQYFYGEICNSVEEDVYTAIADFIGTLGTHQQKMVHEDFIRIDQAGSVSIKKFSDRQDSKKKRYNIIVFHVGQHTPIEEYVHFLGSDTNIREDEREICYLEVDMDNRSFFCRHYEGGYVCCCYGVDKECEKIGAEILPHIGSDSVMTGTGTRAICLHLLAIVYSVVISLICM